MGHIAAYIHLLGNWIRIATNGSVESHKICLVTSTHKAHSSQYEGCGLVLRELIFIGFVICFSERTKYPHMWILISYNFKYLVILVIESVCF